MRAERCRPSAVTWAGFALAMLALTFAVVAFVMRLAAWLCV